MGRIYRPVEVSYNGGREIAVAIVDTGADETVVSQKLADKLKAELYGTFYAVCASQVILEGRYVDLSIKEMMSKKQTTLPVGVSDVPFDTDDIDEEGIDVILGVDFIQKTRLKIEL